MLSNFYINHINAMLRLISENHEKHYTTQWLATNYGIGSSQLKKMFHEITGKGIYAYQLQKKLEYAAGLIRDSEYPIKAIAKKVGFRHASNFTTAFKKQFGITPAKLRSKYFGG